MREQYRDPVPLSWLKGWHIPVAAEYFMTAVVLFVPFGFDQPSSWGLDFNHALIALALLIITSLGALITSLFERTVVGLVMTFIPWLLFLLGVRPN